MVQLDSTNLRLLALLQDDARTSIIDLARAVDRAESTVRERIAAMERSGLLRGYRALVDPERLGYRAHAVVRADCDLRKLPELARRLAAVPQVTSAMLTTGQKPLVVELLAESLPRLEHALEERLAPLDVQAPEVGLVLRQLVEPRPAQPRGPVAEPPQGIERTGASFALGPRPSVEGAASRRPWPSAASGQLMP
jgi:Lrp/AsnC family leucine-responsive transcriptional regulator